MLYDEEIEGAVMVIGNGPTRKDVKCIELSVHLRPTPHKRVLTYACNSAYKDFDHLDYLVAVDAPMIQTIMNDPRGREYMKDQRLVIPNRAVPGGFHWNSGRVAISHAINNHKAHTIFVIGFDSLLNFGENQNQKRGENIYPDSSNLGDWGSDLFARKFWELVLEYKDVHFVILHPKDVKIERDVLPLNATGRVIPDAFYYPKVEEKAEYTKEIPQELAYVPVNSVDNIKFSQLKGRYFGAVPDLKQPLHVMGFPDMFLPNEKGE
jgi:hypothetical protein